MQEREKGGCEQPLDHQRDPRELLSGVGRGRGSFCLQLRAMPEPKHTELHWWVPERHSRGRGTPRPWENAPALHLLQELQGRRAGSSSIRDFTQSPQSTRGSSGLFPSTIPIYSVPALLWPCGGSPQSACMPLCVCACSHSMHLYLCVCSQSACVPVCVSLPDTLQWASA